MTTSYTSESHKFNCNNSKISNISNGKPRSNRNMANKIYNTLSKSENINSRNSSCHINYNNCSSVNSSNILRNQSIDDNNSMQHNNRKTTAATSAKATTSWV
uniref:GG11457 n=1 Tax=Drosophila erecta TaxID=7220 RepID=B3P6A9_DROER